MRRKRTKKLSLGSLRKTIRSSAKAPEFLGEMRLQRKTLSVLNKQFNEQENGDEIVCNLAGWRNTGKRGPFLTVELSPKYGQNTKRANHNNNVKSLEQLFGNDNEETNEISERSEQT